MTNSHLFHSSHPPLPSAPPALRLSVNETLVVDPGKDVTLSCEVTAGFPKPTVSWSRYPNPLPRNSLVRNGTLTLRSVTPADSGFYNCTAVNNVGNPAKRNVNLLVRSECVCVYLIYSQRRKRKGDIWLSNFLVYLLPHSETSHRQIFLLRAGGASGEGTISRLEPPVLSREHARYYGGTVSSCEKGNAHIHRQEP